MTQARSYLIAGLSALIFTVGSLSAHADEGHVTGDAFVAHSVLTTSFAAPEQTREMLAQRSISPSEAKSIALRRVRGGEVVDISRNGKTYRVRVIAKDGRVVDVYIDANTGRVR